MPFTRWLTRAVHTACASALTAPAFALIALAALTGCTTPPPPPSAPPAITAPAAAPARVVVLNHSGYVWRLQFRARASDEVYAVQLPPRSSLLVELSGGQYDIEQQGGPTPASRGQSPAATRTEAPSARRHSPATPDAATAEVRRLPAEFLAGQDYTWRLGTLWAEPSP